MQTKTPEKFAPIGSIVQEFVKFDTQAIQNPEISGIEYQQGTLQGAIRFSETQAA